MIPPLPEIKKRLILLFILPLLASCSGLGGRPVRSPEQEVASSIPRGAQQFQMLTQGVTPEGDVAVVFSYRLPTPEEAWPEDYTLAYKVFERVNWGEWETSWFSMHTSPTLARVAYPIPYDVYQDGYTAVYGPFQSPAEKTVAAIFSNGKAVQGSFDGSGFLLFIEEKSDVCELRFYDSQDSLLREKILSNRSETSDECPRKP